MKIVAKKYNCKEKRRRATKKERRETYSYMCEAQHTQGTKKQTEEKSRENGNKIIIIMHH